jgi:protocatechuate 3,4-dioxygenase beta subunit
VPTRLALRIVDADCNPIPGAEVDIWHTHPKGVYSGEDAAAMCTTGDEEAEASRWFRGVQTTDANGRVDFDTCFPGWYAGRAIHIHVQVRLGGEAFVTSQIFFDQALINEIFASHPDYSKYGAPDTPNAEDNIMNALGGPSSICQHARMEDGALQAWITLAIRSSLDEGLCD